MDGDVYTLGVWTVKPGKESDFIEAWRSLGSYFYSLPQPPGPGTLVQSVQDSTLFYSFGPWGSIADIQAMRADPRTASEIGKLVALCDEAVPGTYRVVASVP